MSEYCEDDASYPPAYVRLSESERGGMVNLVDESEDEESSNRSPVLVRLSDVPRVPINWFWRNRMPRGRISMFCGIGGCAKTWTGLDVAARVTTGSPFPDGSACERGSVLIIAAEDDPGDTLGPRFDAQGGDSSKVMLLSMTRRLRADGSSDEVAFTLADVDVLKSAMKQIKDLALVIIDPIGSFIGGGVNSDKDNEVREVMQPIATAASTHPNKPAVLVIAHKRKSAGQHADDGVLGSRAFSALARAVWHFSTDQVNPQRRLMLPGKQNLGPATGGLAFTIAGDPPALTWERDAVNLTADDAMAAERGGEQDPSDAVEFLQAELADLQEHSVEGIRQNADAAGISWRSIQRASNKLKVKKHRAGFGAGFIWRLPRSVPIRATSALSEKNGTNGTNGTYDVNVVVADKYISPELPYVPTHTLIETPGTNGDRRDPDDIDEREALQEEGM